MISNWTSSIALIQLIAWSDTTPGPSSMTFIQFVTYSVVLSSVGWKPAVVEVLNLLLNLIDSALSILLVKLTSCELCMSCVAGRAAKSEDFCDASKLPAVHWFKDKPSESVIACCVSITSDACHSVRSRVVLPMWANSLSVRIEVDVIDDRTEISLELANMQVSSRATLIPQSRT